MSCTCSLLLTRAHTDATPPPIADWQLQLMSSYTTSLFGALHEAIQQRVAHMTQSFGDTLYVCLGDVTTRWLDESGAAATAEPLVVVTPAAARTLEASLRSALVGAVWHQQRVTMASYDTVLRATLSDAGTRHHDDFMRQHAFPAVPTTQPQQQ